jgi:RNA polymerase sigma factor (TIGR02999 family)
LGCDTPISRFDLLIQLSPGKMKPVATLLVAARQRFSPRGAASMNDVTRILSAIEDGDPRAAEHLLPLVYEELRKLAAAKLAQEKPGQTLQATALVHEAYLRLVDRTAEQQWDCRGHFFAAAAEAMRRILVDRAREKGREKRGGKVKKIDIDAIDLATTVTPDQLLAVDEALAKLAVHDATAAKIVQLRYFAGLTVDEAGKALGISTATAYRHWNYARVWLYDELQGSSES